MFADPQQVRNAVAVARAAHDVFGVDGNALYPKLLNKKSRFVYVQRFADPAKALLLQKRGLAGLGFYPEERRTYPQGKVGAQVVGYAGVDNKGLTGLEVQYDRKLAGRPGSRTIVRDGRGQAIDVIKSLARAEGRRPVHDDRPHDPGAGRVGAAPDGRRPGARRPRPRSCSTRRRARCSRWRRRPASTRTTPRPSRSDLQRNRAVTDTYEPGSTFKLVTVTGVLSEGLVTPETKFTLPYSIQVADRVIHDAENRGTETFSVAQILKYSSNVGAITLAEKLGDDAPRRLDPPVRLRQADRHRLPGRDRRARAAARPVVGLDDRQRPDRPGHRGDADPDGVGLRRGRERRRVGAAAPRERVSAAARRSPRPTAGSCRQAVNREIKTMLTDVVVAGTGTEAAIPGYTVAGKTGTAQKPDGHGGYSGSKFVASFVGMVPASNPRLVVLVMVDEPSGAIWGGVVAAPAFAQIAKFDLQYLEVPPDDAAERNTLSATP